METLLKILIPILMQIESGNNPQAIGDNGDAVGVLQIHKIMVDDVNSLLGKIQFAYRDRLSVSDSKKMCEVYMVGRSNFTNKGLSTEDQIVIMGRNWNGGPKGHLKESTIEYGERVRYLYRKNTKKAETKTYSLKASQVEKGPFGLFVVCALIVFLFWARK